MLVLLSLSWLHTVSTMHSAALCRVSGNVKRSVVVIVHDFFISSFLFISVQSKGVRTRSQASQCRPTGIGRVSTTEWTRQRHRRLRPCTSGTIDSSRLCAYRRHGQWRNDGVAAASSDGGRTGGRGPPTVLEFLVINFSVCLVLLSNCWRGAPDGCVTPLVMGQNATSTKQQGR